MSVSDRLALQNDLLGGIVALLLVAVFAAALAVRAWKNTARLNRIGHRLRAAGATSVQDMDPVAKAALRARLVSAMAASPLGDYFAAPDRPIPYELTDKADALTAVRVRQAGPFCRHYLYRRGGAR